MQLFEAFGIELEYMIVHDRTLDVLPICDRVIEAEIGAIRNDVPHEPIGWSNELVLHVVELKTSPPARSLHALPGAFQSQVQRINEHLAGMEARLMPTAAHPWMNPFKQTRLWPHDYNPIYEAFNRIFDCRGHGWANLQSAHINLPFGDDEQFGRLHAAIRLVLPLIPALAASSPILDGKPTGMLDSRLEAYRLHCREVPSLVGRVIPEPCFTIADYQQGILQRLYDDLDPLDPADVLNEEWVNARGAIARFDRNTIEIRVIDVQECPAADLAIAAAVISVIRRLVSERWCSYETQRRFAVDPLADLLERGIAQAHRAIVHDLDYLKALGLDTDTPMSTGEVWRQLVSDQMRLDPDVLGFCERELAVLLEEGPLAQRIVQRLGNTHDATALHSLYRELCDCLQEGCMLRG